MQQPLIERGLHYHYASAHSPLAAQVLARVGNDRLLKNQHEASALLSQLPIHGVGLEVKLSLQLERLGQRLGQNLLTCLQQLYATSAPNRPAYRPPEHFRQRLELLYEIEHSGALRFPLKRLLVDLEAFLAPRQLRVAGLSLGLEYREHKT